MDHSSSICLETFSIYFSTQLRLNKLRSYTQSITLYWHLQVAYLWISLIFIRNASWQYCCWTRKSTETINCYIFNMLNPSVCINWVFPLRIMRYTLKSIITNRQLCVCFLFGKKIWKSFSLFVIIMIRDRIIFQAYP